MDAVLDRVEARGEARVIELGIRMLAAGREKEFIHSLSDRELQKNYLLSLRLIKADRVFLYG